MYFTNQLSIEHVRYPAVIIKCLEEEMETTDIKTRKFLTMEGGVHPTSSTLRPYMNRGVLSIREITLVGTDMISDMLLSEYLRQQTPPPLEKNSWKHRKSASPYTACTTAKVCEE